MNESAKQIGSNKELAAKVVEMWNRQASAEEIAKVISENGIHAEPSQVEDLLQEMQNKQKAVIATRKLDDEELEMVAGGGTSIDCSSTDDCDRNFRYPMSKSEKRCDSDFMCDEYYKCANDWSCTQTS